MAALAPRKATKYLFTDKQKSFPVVEFKSSADESLNIPSFVLETTWPRIVYIYYPNQSKFDYFHSAYVQVARHIRHESDILVLFYAISCAAHKTMCSNSDLIKHTGVPILKAYESESIKGTEILIEESSNTIENMNKIVNQLSTALSIGSFPMMTHQMPDQGGDISNQSGNMEDIGNMKITNENMLQDTYNDALKAFILTIRYNIYGDFEEVKDDGSLLLSYTKAGVLRDFLDLCYWTLPPDWNIHEILIRLRNDVSYISEGPKYLKSLLSDQNAMGKIEWSESCMSTTLKVVVTEVIDHSSYSCGLWKLLHIISVGVSEARTKAMGDVDRTRPAYAGWVIRDFISEFIPDESQRKKNLLEHKIGWCKGCKKQLISSFDSCKKDDLCIDFVTSDSQLTDEASKVVAEWLWGVHEATKIKSSPIKKIQMSRKKFEYDTLKSEYWPRNLKIVRIAVLKKFSRVFPKITHTSRQVEGHTSLMYISMIAFASIICVYVYRTFQGRSYMRRKIK